MARKPNLLFIFTDEQRFDTMRCYGNDWIQTPNLNNLAEQSFIFENAYVTQPVCTPSRATIMTGLYPHSTGCIANNVPLKAETAAIAEMVADEYLCGYYGKWHLGDEVITQHGFERWLSIEDMYRRYYSKKQYLACMSDYHHFLVESGFEPNGESLGAPVFGRRMVARMPAEFTKACFLGRRAAEFIHDHRDRPFVLYVNFLEPHMPFTGPLDDLYDPAAMPVGPHFRVKPSENTSLIKRRMAELYADLEHWQDTDLTSEAGWRKLRARYMGLVTLVDKAVGTILAALEESGIADNTIVVFTSDHGDMMGDHGIFTKTVMYEEVVKVPLLMRIPWAGNKQRRIAGRVSQVDLVPTLLELMDQPIPRYLEGRSRAGALGGQDTLEGNDVFIEWNGRDNRGKIVDETISENQQQCLLAPWRTIVSADGWKLNLSPHDHCELYDLNSDPCEMNNLFGDPAQQTRIKDLTARIRAWQAHTTDTCPLPEL